MSEEYQYLVQQKNISQYAGQWIAVVGKTLFSGKSLQEALDKAAKKFPKKQPLVMKVPLRAHLSL